MKMKEIIDKYVITTDANDKLDELVNLLKKYNVKAYNYKVEYFHGKVNIRVIKGNVIVNLANLDLIELENILKNSKELYSKFRIEFHNIPSTENIIEKIERINLPYSEIHVYKDRVKIKTSNGFTFEDTLDLEATYYLSSVLDKVKPFNIGRIRKVKDMYALVLLKRYGIRDLDLIERILEMDYKIEDNNIIIKELGIIINEKGIIKDNVLINKKEMYELLKRVKR
ncbi:MAG: hypothetical protein QXR34_07100 [Saccharolobus sp.]